MGQIYQMQQSLPVGFFRDNSLMVPLWQMGLYTTFIACCLLWKRFRLGLSISFVFCFYWGFIANRALFIGNLKGVEKISLPFLLYIGGGFIIITLSLISFFVSDWVKYRFSDIKFHIVAQGFSPAKMQG